MTSKKVIMPLPNNDFDPSEVAITWRIVKSAGFDVVFSTVDGKPAQADAMMISGEGLDPWGWIPLLKKIRFIGLLLRADRHARKAYNKLLNDKNFQTPCKYQDLRVGDYEGLILPGGHAPRIKQYLEDQTLQDFVADFFDSTNDVGQHKPVAAVCHGVVLAARAISKKTDKSVLYGKKTTALTWKLENSAWQLTKYFARFWDPDYYRTYTEFDGEPAGYRGVEQEIKRVLESENDFVDVPSNTPNYALKTSGVARDRINNSKPAWVVQDGNYLSARWPGDVHTLAAKFVEILKQKKAVT